MTLREVGPSPLNRPIVVGAEVAVEVAVEDAVAPMGIELTSSHVDPEELWRAMQEAQAT